MVLLENEYLLVEIATKGAELQKIYNKKEGFDYLWLLGAVQASL